MENKILKIVKAMESYLSTEQLSKLKEDLNIVMYESENNLVKTYDDAWMDILDEFILSKSLEGKSSKTLERYSFEMKRLLSYISKPVDQIISNDISMYLIAYKRIRKVSNSTLKNVRAVFSSFFAWARDYNKIPINPMLQVESIKVEKKLKKPFTDEERELLLRTCKNLRDKAILEFLYSTGVRVSELTQLNISDVHFVDKDLTVYGKGNKERIVYINDKTNMYLREYIKSRTDNNPALFVGVKKPYSRLTKNGVEYIVRELGKKAGVKNSYPHRFRRTIITNALNRGMQLQEVMVFAGHSKPETTMMYCEVDKDSVKLHHKKLLSS